MSIFITTKRYETLYHWHIFYLYRRAHEEPSRSEMCECVQGRQKRNGAVHGTKDDLCIRVHCLLEGLAVSSTAVPVPDSDAAGQHTLNGAPVECVEDGWWETCSFQPAEKV